MARTKGPVRRRTASAEVSAALLNAAETVLDRDGADGVTVRAVASEAGVAPMGVYNRFTNKEGLLTALAIRAFDGLAAAIEVEPNGDPADRLRRACRGYRDFACTHPARYALVFATGTPAADPESPARTRGSEVFGTLVGMVGDLLAADGVTGVDAAEAAQAVWNGCHGAVTIELAGVSQTPDAATTFERMLDTFIAGVSHTPRQRPR